MAAASLFAAIAGQQNSKLSPRKGCSITPKKFTVEQVERQHRRLALL